VVYGKLALLDLAAWGVGIGVGLVMIGGTYAGKRLVDRLPERVFPRLVEVVLVISGIQLLLAI
jgi:uncharacterized protein